MEKVLIFVKVGNESRNGLRLLLYHDCLQFFLGVLNHVSATPRSLETQYLPKQVSSSENGQQLYTSKNAR